MMVEQVSLLDYALKHVGEFEMRFSERHGYSPLRETVQYEAMDDALRNGLWNVLQIHIWDTVRTSNEYFGTANLNNISNRDILLLFRNLWVHYFKRPVDELEVEWRKLHPLIKRDFFSFKWNGVYDFIEFIVQQHKKPTQDRLIIAFDAILERECSAYRFIGEIITNISDESEMDAIETAMYSNDKYINEHIKQSLLHLSSREAPDYRNSMKEAISALERFIVTQSPGEKDFSKALTALIEKSTGHKALQKALNSLYGYASDAEGIRHFLKDDATVSFADAKYFLVLCSSLMMWLRQKSM